MGQMDFDAYEYLEKEVGNPEPEKLEEKVNGGKVTVESEDREHRRSSKHKNSENDNDLYHRSKRAKSGDESRDRGRESGDRDRERGSRDTERADRDRERGHRDKERGVRDHSSPRDVERSDRDRHRRSGEHRNREKDSDREDRNGKNRDRERDRDIGREKDRERGRRDCERDNDKERDMESERERSHRSRSRSERQRDELDREKSRERGFRERERDLREPERESRRYKEKETAEPEVDPERDQRTVFAYQISLKADERDVFEFFSKAGKVRDVKLIMDRNSGRSKGVGYIEFYDAASVPMAIALSGQLLLKHPVMVKPSEAEKNLVQSTVSVAGGAGGLVGPYSGGARRLYVGNLHFNIREDQLRQVFEPFGTVELVQLPLDQETGHSKGYGFVQFARLEEARTAQSLNGLEIAGQPIKVSTVTDQAGMQDIGANPGDFDDDEGGGLALNARSRAILMQKLDRTGTASSITGTLGNPGPGLALPTISPLISPLVQAPIPAVTIPSFDIIGVPSECLLLKNMFDPKLESDPDFDLDIKEDVQEECSKYGMLKHVFVDKNTAGSVYLRFDNTQAAMGAQRALHGRWFAGKMITATFMLPHNYEAKFPDSR